MQTHPDTVYEFGQFEVSAASGELLRDGTRVKLQEQPFRLLVVLLENAGEVVTREELRDRIWPKDTFVDFDGSLRVAIRKLREALHDDVVNPRYIETIPKRGYRFLGSVERSVSSTLLGTLPRREDGFIGEPEVSVHDVVPVVMVEPDRGSLFHQTWLKITVSVLAISGVALAAVVGFRWHRQQRPQEPEALTAVPFTALPGRASFPAFSPDGSRIAFAWNGDPAQGIEGFDLYVKALGSETLLRLTQHPSKLISPTWSPDGTQVAFHRMDGADTGIYVVPALGGQERKLRSTRISRSDLVINSWSPDGKWIAFADRLPSEEHAKIYLLSTEILETKRIPISPMCVSEGQPAFSHNGEYLAYWCFRSDDEAALYSLPLPAGKPKMIVPFLVDPNGLTWSADDKKLIYSRWKGRGSDELGEVTVANGSVKRLTLEGSAMRPAVSPKADKLAYSSLSISSTIWRRDQLHSESPGVELFPSSRTQYDAQYSPNGKRIAFASMRSGVQGVWTSNDDGSNVVQISDPNFMSGSPEWSPDGNRIAFDSRPLDRWEIYVVDVGERKPRKLVTNISGVFRPHWSRDGKWIYFSSNETGRAGIYRCPSSGGDAVLLSKDGDGFNPQESFDGKTVYFASHTDASTLKKVPLPGQPGTESEVDELPRLSESRNWALSPGGIYFVSTEAPRSVRYFDFASKQIRSIFEVDKGFGTGLSVSSDGRWILYSQDRSVTGDIMLVDHFH